jgi:hypothetical protein
MHSAPVLVLLPWYRWGLICFGRGKNATSDMWYDTDVTGVNYSWVW